MRLRSRRWSCTNFNVCTGRFDIMSSEWARLHNLKSGESNSWKHLDMGLIRHSIDPNGIYISEAMSEWDCLLRLECYCTRGESFNHVSVCDWLRIRECLTPRINVWHLKIVSERNILIPSSTVWCQLHRTNGFVQIPLTLLCQPHRPDGVVKIPLSPSHRIQVMYPKMTGNWTQIHWD